ncbi:MAG: hypothetical protein M3040_12895 [Bacteroidota bacterium]|nr:hypothetical protein [Bacteroidota bacterium]
MNSSTDQFKPMDFWQKPVKRVFGQRLIEFKSEEGEVPAQRADKEGTEWQ